MVKHYHKPTGHILANFSAKNQRDEKNDKEIRGILVMVLQAIFVRTILDIGLRLELIQSNPVLFAISFFSVGNLIQYR